MNIEKSIEILKEFRKYNKIYKEENKDLTITITLEAKESIDKAIERLLTAYEKEKEKNKELSNSYDKLAKECNEENRRCMLLAVENQDLKEKNKELNILRLELLISQFPDTTETYKKYKKELEELLKEE